MCEPTLNEQLEALYPRLQARACGCVPFDEVCDIVHEAVVAVLDAFKAGTIRSNVESFAYVVFENQIKDWYRRRSRSRKYQSQCPVPETCCDPQAEHVADATEAVDAIRGVLPPELTDVFELVLVAKLPPPEAASLLGLSQHQLRLKRHRVIAIIKDHFQETRP